MEAGKDILDLCEHLVEAPRIELWAVERIGPVADFIPESGIAELQRGHYESQLFLAIFGGDIGYLLREVLPVEMVHRSHQQSEGTVVGHKFFRDFGSVAELEIEGGRRVLRRLVEARDPSLEGENALLLVISIGDEMLSQNCTLAHASTRSGERIRNVKKTAHFYFLFIFLRPRSVLERPAKVVVAALIHHHVEQLMRNVEAQSLDIDPEWGAFHVERESKQSRRDDHGVFVLVIRQLTGLKSSIDIRHHSNLSGAKFKPELSTHRKVTIRPLSQGARVRTVELDEFLEGLRFLDEEHVMQKSLAQPHFVFVASFLLHGLGKANVRVH